MEIVAAILTVLGPALFEITGSIDDAITDADVRGIMGEWPRKWFLLWGIIFAVFVIRRSAAVAHCRAKGVRASG